jgi:hypothetical protein
MVVERIRVNRKLQLLERLVFDLANALAGHIARARNLLERAQVRKLGAGR